MHLIKAKVDKVTTSRSYDCYVIQYYYQNCVHLAAVPDGIEPKEGDLMEILRDRHLSYKSYCAIAFRIVERSSST